MMMHERTSSQEDNEGLSVNTGYTPACRAILGIPPVTATGSATQSDAQMQPPGAMDDAYAAACQPQAANGKPAFLDVKSDAHATLDAFIQDVISRAAKNDAKQIPMDAGEQVA